ncbi:sigma-70 family RNA polymerase sigma factor [Hypericibacter sp.]|uniref:sigma-70 family RNA polymerase sigma factor n=1 Tax=Hypericibacter sp. TaxID=2705401 RepID=UPI003D6C9F52
MQPTDPKPLGPVSQDFARLLGLIAANRDEDAFAQIFDHYGPRVKAYFRRLGMPSAAAEDLVQDVMVAVWQKAGQFDPSRATAATWIYAIARNRRIDLLRRERRPEIDPTDPMLMPGPEADPYNQVVVAQAESRLQRAVATLPEDQVFLLHKSFFEDKSHSVIAAELGLPLGTVKSRLRLALGKLKAIVKEPT